MDASPKRQELDELKARVERLEAEIHEEDAGRDWRATGYYPAYYATTGALLGIFGAVSSLLFNIIGSLVAGKDPLKLVRIYLTFPLGEQALRLSEGSQGAYAVTDSVILAIGCCLYIATGMILGIPVYLALTRLAGKAGLFGRLVVGGLVSLAIWLVNFYGVLAWLQPALFGGDWIVRLVPWWVAAATHLVFGLTIVLLYRLGEYTPYRRIAAAPAA
jgi:hypothetical protein